MVTSTRPVAIVGGVRIPFCRSGSSYAMLSNQQMLTTAMRGLVEKYDLQGQEIGEVYAGAVINQPKDWNLAREVVLSTELAPTTPGLTMQQACGTSLQAAMVAAAKIATGQIDSAIASGSDTVSDVPILFGKKISKRLAGLGKARSFGAKLKVFKGFSPGELTPVPPSVNEPRTLMSMGQHCELMAQEWGITREAQDQLALESHLKASAAYDSGFFDELIVPCEGTPLTDGASTVLLASEEWARERGLPILGYLTHSATAAVDFVGGEGLLMGPTVAVSNMLKQADLTLQEFDFYEIHEAFAAQVLCTLKAWESTDYCVNRLGRDAALGSIDRSKMNVKGSSLAVGHPFAATGARIVGTLAKILEEAGGGRGLISVCTAGGMGVSAILEK